MLLFPKQIYKLLTFKITFENFFLVILIDKILYMFQATIFLKGKISSSSSIDSEYHHQIFITEY